MSNSLTPHEPPHVNSLGARLLLGVLLAVGTFVASIAQMMHGGVFANSAAHAPLNTTTIALAAAMTAPLVVWWRWPLAVFAASATASVLLVGLGRPLDMAVAPAAALFFVAADEYGVRTGPRCRVVVMAGCFIAFLTAAGFAQQAAPGVALVHTGLVWAGAWFAGDRTRLSRFQVADLRERADRAVREAERERLLAVAEERTRIARDLHDSAGHAISVIAVRAGAARLRNDPSRSQAALAAIEEVARQTVADIEQIVGGLRQPGEDDAVTPHGIASLDALVAQLRDADTTVDVVVSGEQRPLRPATDQAVYRILQESLTNAARHGAGTTEVRVAYRDDAVEVSVSNAVQGVASDGGRAGHGLVGMQERVALLAGRLEAGRTASGTFVVKVWLPDGRHNQ